jgi:hypothetical protein
MSQAIILSPEDRNTSKTAFFLDVLGRRMCALLFSSLALILACFVPLEALPALECSFLSLTGYPCPFCGTTRSFWAMAHGDLPLALYNSPLGALLYPATWLMFIYFALMASIELSLGRLLPLFHVPGRAAVIVFGVAVTINWIYRLAMGLQ